jgi:hypothetical protein
MLELGRRHQHAMLKLAVAHGEALHAAGNTTDMRRERIRDHEDVHDEGFRWILS